MWFILGTLRKPQAKACRATHQSTVALHIFLTQHLPSSCAIAAPLPPSVFLGSVTRAGHSTQYRSTPQVTTCHQQGLQITFYSWQNHRVPILLSWGEKTNLSQCLVSADKISSQLSSEFLRHTSAFIGNFGCKVGARFRITSLINGCNQFLCVPKLPLQFKNAELLWWLCDYNIHTWNSFNAFTSPPTSFFKEKMMAVLPLSDAWSSFSLLSSIIM